MAQVLDGKTFLLASGETVRLASIESPPRTSDSFGLAARLQPAVPSMAQASGAALDKLLVGHGVHIDAVAVGHDRHDRIIGQATREDGLWIQGEMLRQGFGMVYSFPGDAPALIAKMLAFEQEAQKNKRGLWADPYFRVLSPAETLPFAGQFRLVEGKVISAHAYHGNLYLNFAERWKGNFAVFISHKYLPAFAALNLEGFAGKTIRVRGWINSYNGAPSIDLTHPAQIELR